MGEKKLGEALDVERMCAHVCVCVGVKLPGVYLFNRKQIEQEVMHFVAENIDMFRHEENVCKCC